MVPIVVAVLPLGAVMLISPDNFLLDPDGEYVWTPERLFVAWNMTHDAIKASVANHDRIVLLCGLPGSGKSTWLASHYNEDIVWVDATLTKRKLRKGLAKFCREVGYKRVSLVVFQTPEAICRERNDVRVGIRRVCEDHLTPMIAQMKILPTVEEGFDDIEFVVHKD